MSGNKQRRFTDVSPALIAALRAASPVTARTSQRRATGKASSSWDPDRSPPATRCAGSSVIRKVALGPREKYTFSPSRETVGRRLVVRIEELLAARLGVFAGAESPDERAQDCDTRDACEAGQHHARQAHHLWALGPEAKAGRGLVPGVVVLLRMVVAHRGLPSVRTMRIFCCLSPPRRSSAAAKSRSTM
jgi:hypothetical protein